MSKLLSKMDLENSRYRAGERAHVEVMNRPVVALHNADTQLDEAMQFISKTGVLGIRNETKFHSHTDGSSLTGRNNNNYVGGTFVNDYFCRGSAHMTDNTECVFSAPSSLIDTTRQGTLMFWAKLGSLSHGDRTTGYISPVGIQIGANRIGPVHKASDSSSYKIRLANEANATNGITIDSGEVGKYIFFALRTNGTGTFELTVIPTTNDVYTQTLTGQPTSTTGTLIIGSHWWVSEIRYDYEWLNDFQLLCAALYRKPWFDPNDTGIILRKMTMSDVNIVDPNPASSGSAYYSVPGTYSFLVPYTGTYTIKLKSGDGLEYTTSTTYEDDWEQDSCFIPGTPILMADGSQKAIEDIQIGDMVMGIDGLPNRVITPHTTYLGDRRSMLTFADGSLTWTPEHPMWIKDHTGDEFWGVHDYNQYLRELGTYETDGGTLEYRGVERRPIIVIHKDVQFAHLDGWLSKRAVVDHQYGPESVVHSLATDRTHTYIANGYVVAGMVNDNDCDYSTIKWIGGKNSEGVQQYGLGNNVYVEL